MLTVLLLLQAAANAQLGYRLTLPDDFIRITDLIPFPGRDIVDCWGGEASGGGNLILCVERMHTELSPQHLQQADRPPSQQLTTVKWKDYDVDATRTDTMLGPVAAVIYTARVPLNRCSGSLQLPLLSCSYELSPQDESLTEPDPGRAPPNERLKLAGALVVKEAVVSCPGGHGTFVHYPCAGWRVARSLSASR